MSDSPPQQQENDCLSTLALVRLIKRGAKSGAPGLEHLDACEICRNRFEQLKNEPAGKEADLGAPQFFEPESSETNAALPTPWTTRRVWLISAAVVSFALAIGIGLTLAEEAEAPQVNPKRLKAPWALVVLVREGGAARPLIGKERLKPGAVLEFEAVAPLPAYVFLAGVAETGEVRAIIPEGQNAIPVTPDMGVSLPVTMWLDKNPGNERIFALFCDHEPDEGDALEALDKQYQPDPQGRRDLEPAPPRSVGSCPMRSVLVRKALEP